MRRLGVRAAFAFGLAGCAGATGSGDQVAYHAASFACVDYAHSTAQSLLCQARLEAMWCGAGGLWTGIDAGACDVPPATVALVPALDAAREGGP